MESAPSFIQKRAQHYNNRVGEAFRYNVYSGIPDVPLPYNLWTWGLLGAAELKAGADYLNHFEKSSWSKIRADWKSVFRPGPHAKYVTSNVIMGGSLLYLSYVYHVYAFAVADYIEEVLGRGPILPIGRRGVIYDYPTMEQIRGGWDQMRAFPVVPMSQLNRTLHIEKAFNYPISGPVGASTSGMALS